VKTGDGCEKQVGLFDLLLNGSDGHLGQASGRRVAIIVRCDRLGEKPVSTRSTKWPVSSFV